MPNKRTGVSRRRRADPRSRPGALRARHLEGDSQGLGRPLPRLLRDFDTNANAVKSRPNPRGRTKCDGLASTTATRDLSPSVLTRHTLEAVKQVENIAVFLENPKQSYMRLRARCEVLIERSKATTEASQLLRRASQELRARLISIKRARLARVPFKDDIRRPVATPPPAPRSSTQTP
jgi:hypothetical protein